MRVVNALKNALPSHALLWRDEETTPYECDGLTAYRQRPLVVALPEDEAQVQVQAGRLGVTESFAQLDTDGRLTL